MDLSILFHRLRWLHAPLFLLVLLLQRAPVLRLFAGTSPDFGLRAGDLLKSAFALAALGAVDTVAGATTFNSAPVAPTTATPGSTGVGGTFSVSSPVEESFGLSFTVSGSPASVGSWKVSGSLPPGIGVNGGAATASGVVVNGFKLTLSGTPASAGSYTLTVGAYENSNAGGRGASVTCRVKISGVAPPAAPVFATEPASRTVAAGSNVTFTAVVAGSPAPTLQWFKDDEPLPGKTAATLTLVAVQPAAAGGYRLVATNDSAPGGVSSATATLAVNHAPIVASAPPAALTAGLGETVTLSVAATARPAAAYQWRKGATELAGQNGPDLVLGPIAFADAGTYSVVVSNAVGSRTLSTRLSVIVPPPADLVDPGTLKTGSSVRFDLGGGRPVPEELVYKAKGLPAGLTLDPATGIITGVIKARPGAAKVLTYAQAGALKSVTKTATLLIGAFPASLVGKYEALLDAAGETPLPAGKLSLAVAANGAVTGTLLADDLAGLPVRGGLVLAESQTSAAATLSVARAKPLPPYTLVLSVHDNAPALAATLSLGADILGAATEGARLLGAAPAGAVGPHTLLLSAPTNLGSVAEFPLGFGHATATLNAKGVLTLSGKHADGARFTASLPLGADRVARLYSKPYALVGGYLAGPLPFTPRADNPDRWRVTASAGSELYWRKPDPVAATANYADGFGPLALTARIEPWTKPAAAAPLPPLLGLTPSGDVALEIAATGVANTEDDPRGLPVALHFDPIKNLFAVVGANPAVFTAKLAPATGALGGGFILKTIPPLAPRKVTFAGVAIQHAPDDGPGPVAGGFFLLPAAAAGGPVFSGRVVLSVAP